ncbi:MAG TPA: hypothetical protein DDZ89_02230, partial [Clostridiales bacterium]|nr:hypothetical protein [Clostridiales bacterium]
MMISLPMCFFISKPESIICNGLHAINLISFVIIHDLLLNYLISFADCDCVIYNGIVLQKNWREYMTAVYKSIDLFAGIGGIRLGFDQAFQQSIETVFISEWDKNAQKTYYANFTDKVKIN